MSSDVASVFARVGLVEACTDPHVFALSPWPRQREVLATVAGSRLTVLCLGRRSGKTTHIAAPACAHDALFRPDLDRLVRPGERRYAVVVATNREQARLLIRAVRGIVEASPLLAPLLAGATEDELRFTLPWGARTAVLALPCSSRASRGYPISTLVLDEAAHLLTEAEGPAAADRVFAALMPATAQFGDGARVIISSTPWGSSGFFADIFRRAELGELGVARAVRFTTAEMNPTISADFLEGERARDPDTFASEYLAEFVGSGDAFLDPARYSLEGAAAEPGDGWSWVAGLDPAFQRDPFGVALVGRARHDRDLLVTGRVEGLLPGRAGSFEDRRLVEDRMLSEVAAICRAYGARAVSDQYASAAVRERLTREGIPVEVVAMTSTTKTQVYAELRTRLYAGQLRVHEDELLALELRRLRARFTAGQAAVVSPRVGGSHGDRAQALAMAVAAHAGQLGGAPPRVLAGGESVFSGGPIDAPPRRRRAAALLDPLVL